MTGAVSPRVTVKVLDDQSALARAAADEFTRCAREAEAARGQFTIALSGGSTPRTMYEALAGRPYRDTIVWPDVHVFWGDERHVPPAKSDSNFRMAYAAWLSRVPLPPANIHRVKAEMSDARSAAADYERTLREFFGLQAGEFPRFDLVLLGLGPDGHTASLFPYSDALREASRLVVAPWVEQVAAYRITLTLPALSAAASVVFLVSGPDKAEAVRAVLRGEFDPERLPAQLVRPPSGSVAWFLDRDVARLLEQRQLKEDPLCDPQPLALAHGSRTRSPIGSHPPQETSSTTSSSINRPDRRSWNRSTRLVARSTRHGSTIAAWGLDRTKPSAVLGFAIHARTSM